MKNYHNRLDWTPDDASFLFPSITFEPPAPWEPDSAFLSEERMAEIDAEVEAELAPHKNMNHFEKSTFHRESEAVDLSYIFENTASRASRQRRRRRTVATRRNRRSK